MFTVVPYHIRILKILYHQHIKKYVIIVEDAKAEELTELLKKLPFVKQVKESDNPIDSYTLKKKGIKPADELSERLYDLHMLMKSLNKSLLLKIFCLIL